MTPADVARQLGLQLVKPDQGFDVSCDRGHDPFIMGGWRLFIIRNELTLVRTPDGAGRIIDESGPKIILQCRDCPHNLQWKPERPAEVWAGIAADPQLAGRVVSLRL